jgi:DNA invertase Pin-like site-specific DNA recombinase
MDQNLDLQRDALRRAGCRTICEDRASGSDSQRPQLLACLERLSPGDCLVVWRLDRLGRSLSDLIHIVSDLERRTIGFESLMERIDTVSPAGRLMFHVLGALAEFERSLIRERILAGLAAARARGRSIGRPRKLDRERVRKLRALLLRKGMTVARAAQRLGVSRATAFRWLPSRKKLRASYCSQIKKDPSIMKKYVFKIGMDGAGDSERATGEEDCDLGNGGKRASVAGDRCDVRSPKKKKPRKQERGFSRRTMVSVKP